ncbi:MAG: phospholipase D-like domain-containing protein [Candidatus Gracilibacteria bacterium]|jgi:hypothetical protein
MLSEIPIQEQTSGGVRLYKPRQLRDQLLLRDIPDSKKYVLSKTYLARDDSFGNGFARAVLASNGEFTFLKDRTASVYEYGEPNGKSLVHPKGPDNPVHAFYGKIISTLYGHKVENGEHNPLWREIASDPSNNILIDDLHDHSKVTVVDGKVAWVTGINFGNEHLKNDAWHDMAIRIEDPEQCLKLLKLLAGETRGAKEDGSGINFLHGDGEVLKPELVKFIEETRDELTVFMAYLGDPDFTQALAKILQKGCRIKLIVPENPSVNRGHNLTALNQLVNAGGFDPRNLEIFLSPEMGHGKGLLRDNKTAWIGSKNMTRADMLMDTVVTVQDPIVVTTFQQAAAEIQAHATLFTGSELKKKFGKVSPKDQLLQVLENIGLTFTEATFALNADEIARARGLSRDQIKQVLQRFHGGASRF